MSKNLNKISKISRPLVIFLVIIFALQFPANLYQIDQLISNGLFNFFNQAQTATSGVWNQNDWTGGANPGSKTNQNTGWNQYDSATNIDTTWANQMKLKFSPVFSWSENKLLNKKDNYSAQGVPSFVVNSSGAIFATWTDSRNGYFKNLTDFANLDVFVQAYDSDGNKLAPEDINVLSATDTNNQVYSSIALDSSENIYVVWMDDRNGPNNYDIYAQKFDSSGNRQWGNSGLQITTNINSENYPVIAVDSSNIYVVWEDGRNGNLDIYAQKLNPDGTKQWTEDVKVNSNSGSSSQGDPSIAIDSGNNIYISWEDGRNGNLDIYAQKLNPDGTKQWTEDVKVNSNSGSSSQENPAITTDSSNNICVTWQDSRNDNPDIYAQKLNPDGTKQWAGDVKVNSDSGFANQQEPSISVSSTNFYIAWQDNRDANLDIYAQKLDSNGAKQWKDENNIEEDKRANAITTSIQEFPTVSVQPGTENILVAWQDSRRNNYDVFFQLLDGLGKRNITKINPDNSTTDADYKATTEAEPADQALTSVVLDTTGNYFYAAWSDARQGKEPGDILDKNFDIFLQKFDKKGEKKWSKDIRVTHSSAMQEFPSLAVDTAGNIFVAWMDLRENVRIYIQKYNSNGVAQWADQGIQITTESDFQFFPDLAFDSKNNALIITWSDGRNNDPVDEDNVGDIYAQKLDLNGNRLWGSDIKVSSLINVNEIGSRVGVDSNGNIYIVWMADKNYGDIYVQKLDTNGNKKWDADKQILAETSEIETYPDIAISSAGNSYIVWQGNNDGDFDIYIQKLDAQGNKKWSGEKKINTATEPISTFLSQTQEKKVQTAACEIPKAPIECRLPGSGGGASPPKYQQIEPSISLDSNENSYISWRDYNQGWKIFVQKYNAEGIRIWTEEAQINSEGEIYNKTILGFSVPQQSSAARSDFYIVWPDNRNGDFDVFAQRLEADTYASSGSLVSSIFDAGESVAWKNIVWQSDIPAGSLNISVATSNDGTNWSGWKFVPANNSNLSSLGVATSRYIKYKADFTSGSASPVLKNISINFTYFPQITSISPEVGAARELITIYGYNFGNSPTSSSKVTFQGPNEKRLEAEIESWTDTQVTVIVPDNASSGDVIITTIGGDSNPYAFYIEASLYLDKKVTITRIREAEEVTSKLANYALTSASFVLANGNDGKIDLNTLALISGLASTISLLIILLSAYFKTGNLRNSLGYIVQKIICFLFILFNFNKKSQEVHQKIIKFNDNTIGWQNYSLAAFKRDRRIVFYSASGILLALVIQLALLASSIDTINVPLGKAFLTKVTSESVKPGDKLIYRIDFKNQSNSPIFDIFIHDEIPAGTIYKENSLVIDDGPRTDRYDPPDSADFNVSNPNAATFKLGVANPGRSGYVQFEVEISKYPDVDNIINRAYAKFKIKPDEPERIAASNAVISPVYKPPIPISTKGSINGLVFHDANNNQSQNEGEEGLASVLIDLFVDSDKDALLSEADKLSATRTTNSNGSFNFSDLEANSYFINIESNTLPQNYQLTTDNLPWHVKLASGQNISSVFGYATTEEITAAKEKEKEEKEKEKEKEKEEKPLTLTENIRTNPIVKVVAPVTAAAAAAAAAASIISLASLIIPGLQLIGQTTISAFSGLFFGRGKKRKWGIVYDAITKQPIDLALVRLYNAETNKLLKTQVTNNQGRYYGFLVEKGRNYYLSIVKPGYIFPSRYLEGKPKDSTYSNLYYGKVIHITNETKFSVPSIKKEKGYVLETGYIAFNIPLDPAEKVVFNPQQIKPLKTKITNLTDLFKLNPKERLQDIQNIIKQFRYQQIKTLITYSAPLVGIIALFLSPNKLTLGALLLQIIFFFIFLRLGKKRVKPWGEIFDLQTKQKIEKAIVRLFDPKYGKLLATIITGRDGRYGFLVGEGKYYLTVEKPGFTFPEGRIEIEGKKEEIVTKDIGLKKIK